MLYNVPPLVGSECQTKNEGSTGRKVLANLSFVNFDEEKNWKWLITRDSQVREAFELMNGVPFYLKTIWKKDL